MIYCAYLDIETTGLSPSMDRLTVVGIMIENDSTEEIIQLVGDEITLQKLSNYLDPVDILYTYNGRKFDLPFIRTKLNINLENVCEHKDLMYSCWQNNLYGGLKAVERRLGIKRKLPDVNGYVAVQLWKNYEQNGSQESLQKLLDYNREDVVNLKILREKLKT